MIDTVDILAPSARLYERVYQSVFVATMNLRDWLLRARGFAVDSDAPPMNGKKAVSIIVIIPCIVIFKLVLKKTNEPMIFTILFF